MLIKENGPATSQHSLPLRRPRPQHPTIIRRRRAPRSQFPEDRWRPNHLRVRRSSIAKAPAMPVLCGFGEARFGANEYRDLIQPRAYRALEVIMDMPWSYFADIWNVGVVVWSFFECFKLVSWTDMIIYSLGSFRADSTFSCLWT